MTTAWIADLESFARLRLPSQRRIADVLRCDT